LFLSRAKLEIMLVSFSPALTPKKSSSFAVFLSGEA
jgi:hypothetical protein